MESWSQSKHPPTPFNQIEKSSWASTSTSEFSEEEIFSWFNRATVQYYKLWHMKNNQAIEKCTTALVLYKIIKKTGQ